MAEAYDLDALRRGLESIQANIAALEEALEKERQKARDYDKHIIGAEAILAAHLQGLPDNGS